MLTAIPISLSHLLSVTNPLPYLVSSGTWSNGNPKTITEDDLNANLTVYGSTTSKATAKIQIQIEVGTATEYEPYVEPVEVNKDEVRSLYPTTTLYSDTVGVKIDVEYNRDINKAFADQQAQIDELKALILNVATN